MRRLFSTLMLMALALGPVCQPLHAFRQPRAKKKARPQPQPATRSNLARPVILPSPALEAVEAQGGVTTLSPGFGPWFQRAVEIARKSWKLPPVTNVYGEKVTEESFLRAILFIESAGVHARPGKLTRSAAGAMGFMQLMPGTAKDLGADAMDPEENLLGGVRYLTYCFRSKGAQVKGDTVADSLSKVAAAYNSGPGRRNLLQPWNQYVGTGYKETTGYGIKLKMCLGLPLSLKEKTWMASASKRPVGWVDQHARTLYAHSHGLMKPKPLLEPVPPGSTLQLASAP